MCKVLFVILTCNRFYYLKNCLDSIFEFVKLDNCKVMVVDNCTIDPDIESYISSFADRIIFQQFHDRIPNELYRAMNYAIKYAIKHKIPYINFIQDDYQYVYSQPEMVDNVVHLFETHHNIGQIQTNLIWKRKSPGRVKIIESNGINYAVFQEKMFVDNGFTRTRIYKKIGLYPESVISYDQNSSKTFGFGKNRYKKTPNGELWFGKKCRKLGLSRAISLFPNMAMMFDSSYVRKWNRFGRYFPPPNKYYLKPFDLLKVERIQSKHDKKEFSYIESFVEADGWTPTTHDKHNREKIITEIKY